MESPKSLTLRVLLLLVVALPQSRTKSSEEEYEDLRPSLACMWFGDKGCLAKCNILRTMYKCESVAPKCDGVYCDCHETLLPSSVTPQLKIANEKNLSFRRLLAVKFLRTPVFADLDKQMNEKPKLKASVTRYLRDTPGYGKPYKEALKDAFPQIRPLIRRLKPRPLAEIENITIHQVREEMIRNEWLPPSLEMGTRALGEERKERARSNDYFTRWNSGYLMLNDTQIIIAADTFTNICEEVNNMENEQREPIPQRTPSFTSRRLLQVVENEEISPVATEPVASTRKMKIQRVKKWRRKAKTGNADDDEESSEEEQNQAKKLLRKRRVKVKEPGVEGFELEENAVNDDSTTTTLAITRSIPWNNDDDLWPAEAKEEPVEKEEPKEEPVEKEEPEEKPVEKIEPEEADEKPAPDEYVLVEEKLIVEESPKGENTFLVVEEPLTGEKSQTEETTNAPTTENGSIKKPLKKRRKTAQAPKPVKSGPKIMRVKKYRKKNKPPLPKKRIKKRRKISDKKTDGGKEDSTTLVATEKDQAVVDSPQPPTSEAEFSNAKSISEPVNEDSFTPGSEFPEQQTAEQTKEEPSVSAASSSSPMVPGEESPPDNSEPKKPSQTENRNTARALTTPTKSGESAIPTEAINSPGVESENTPEERKDGITESEALTSVLKSQPEDAAIDREGNVAAKETETNDSPKKRRRSKSQPGELADHNDVPVKPTPSRTSDNTTNTGPIKGEPVENLDENKPESENKIDGVSKRRRKAKDKPNALEFGEQELPNSTQSQDALKAPENEKEILPNGDTPKRRRKVKDTSTLGTPAPTDENTIIAQKLPSDKGSNNEPESVDTPKKRRRTKETVVDSQNPPNTGISDGTEKLDPNTQKENQEESKPEVKDTEKKQRRVKDKIVEPTEITPMSDFENAEQHQISASKNENPEEITTGPEISDNAEPLLVSESEFGKQAESSPDTEILDTASQAEIGENPKKRRRVKDKIKESTGNSADQPGESLHVNPEHVEDTNTDEQQIQSQNSDIPKRRRRVKEAAPDVNQVEERIPKGIENGKNVDRQNLPNMQQWVKDKIAAIPKPSELMKQLENLPISQPLDIMNSLNVNSDVPAIKAISLESKAIEEDLPKKEPAVEDSRRRRNKVSRPPEDTLENAEEIVNDAVSISENEGGKAEPEITDTSKKRRRVKEKTAESAQAPADKNVMENLGELEGLDGCGTSPQQAKIESVTPDVFISENRTDDLKKEPVVDDVPKKRHGTKDKSAKPAEVTPSTTGEELPENNANTQNPQVNLDVITAKEGEPEISKSPEKRRRPNNKTVEPTEIPAEKNVLKNLEIDEYGTSPQQPKTQNITTDVSPVVEAVQEDNAYKKSEVDDSPKKRHRVKDKSVEPAKDTSSLALLEDSEPTLSPQEEVDPNLTAPKATPTTQTELQEGSGTPKKRNRVKEKTTEQATVADKENLLKNLNDGKEIDQSLQQPEIQNTVVETVPQVQGQETNAYKKLEADELPKKRSQVKDRLVEPASSNTLGEELLENSGNNNQGAQKEVDLDATAAEAASTTPVDSQIGKQEPEKRRRVKGKSSEPAGALSENLGDSETSSQQPTITANDSPAVETISKIQSQEKDSPKRRDRPVKTSASTPEKENQPKNLLENGEGVQSPLQEKLDLDVTAVEALAAVVTDPIIENQEDVQSIPPKKPKKSNGVKDKVVGPEAVEFEASPSSQQKEVNEITAEAPLMNENQETELSGKPEENLSVNGENLPTPQTTETPSTVEEVKTPSNILKKDNKVKTKTVSPAPKSEKELENVPEIRIPENKDKLEKQNVDLVETSANAEPATEKRIKPKADGVTPKRQAAESMKTTPSKPEVENQNLDNTRENIETTPHKKNLSTKENLSSNGPEKQPGLQKVLDGFLNPSQLKEQLDDLLTPEETIPEDLPKLKEKEKNTKAAGEVNLPQTAQKKKTGASKSAKSLPTSETLASAPESVGKPDNTSSQTIEEVTDGLTDTKNIPEGNQHVQNETTDAEGTSSKPENENQQENLTTGYQRTEETNTEPEGNNMDSILEIPDVSEVDQRPEKANTNSERFNSSEATSNVPEKQKVDTKSNEKTTVDPAAETSSDENKKTPEESDAVKSMKLLETSPPVLEEIPSMFANFKQYLSGTKEPEGDKGKMEVPLDSQGNEDVGGLKKSPKNAYETSKPSEYIPVIEDSSSAAHEKLSDGSSPSAPQEEGEMIAGERPVENSTAEKVEITGPSNGNSLSDESNATAVKPTAKNVESVTDTPEFENLPDHISSTKQSEESAFDGPETIKLDGSSPEYYETSKHGKKEDDSSKQPNNLPHVKDENMLQEAALDKLNLEKPIKSASISENETEKSNEATSAERPIAETVQEKLADENSVFNNVPKKSVVVFEKDQSVLQSLEKPSSPENSDQQKGKLEEELNENVQSEENVPIEAAGISGHVTSKALDYLSSIGLDKFPTPSNIPTKSAIQPNPVNLDKFDTENQPQTTEVESTAYDKTTNLPIDQKINEVSNDLPQAIGDAANTIKTNLKALFSTPESEKLPASEPLNKMEKPNKATPTSETVQEEHIENLHDDKVPKESDDATFEKGQSVLPRLEKPPSPKDIDKQEERLDEEPDENMQSKKDLPVSAARISDHAPSKEPDYLGSNKEEELGSGEFFSLSKKPAGSTVLPNQGDGKVKDIVTNTPKVAKVESAAANAAIKAPDHLSSNEQEELGSDEFFSSSKMPTGSTVLPNQGDGKIKDLVNTDTSNAPQATKVESAATTAATKAPDHLSSNEKEELGSGEFFSLSKKPAESVVLPNQGDGKMKDLVSSNAPQATKVESAAVNAATRASDHLSSNEEEDLGSGEFFSLSKKPAENAVQPNQSDDKVEDLVSTDKNTPKVEFNEGLKSPNDEESSKISSDKPQIISDTANLIKSNLKALLNPPESETSEPENKTEKSNKVTPVESPTVASDKAVQEKQAENPQINILKKSGMAFEKVPSVLSSLGKPPSPKNSDGHGNLEDEPAENVQAKKDGAKISDHAAVSPNEEEELASAEFFSSSKRPAGSAVQPSVVDDKIENPVNANANNAPQATKVESTAEHTANRAPNDEEELGSGEFFSLSKTPAQPNQKDDKIADSVNTDPATLSQTSKVTPKLPGNEEGSKISGDKPKLMDNAAKLIKTNLESLFNTPQSDKLSAGSGTGEIDKADSEIVPQAETHEGQKKDDTNGQTETTVPPNLEKPDDKREEPLSKALEQVTQKSGPHKNDLPDEILDHAAASTVPDHEDETMSGEFFTLNDKKPVENASKSHNADDTDKKPLTGNVPVTTSPSVWQKIFKMPSMFNTKPDSFEQENENDHENVLPLSTELSEGIQESFTSNPENFARSTSLPAEAMLASSDEKNASQDLPPILNAFKTTDASNISVKKPLSRVTDQDKLAEMTTNIDDAELDEEGIKETLLPPILRVLGPNKAVEEVDPKASTQALESNTKNSKSQQLPIGHIQGKEPEPIEENDIDGKEISSDETTSPSGEWQEDDDLSAPIHFSSLPTRQINPLFNKYAKTLLDPLAAETKPLQGAGEMADANTGLEITTDAKHDSTEDDSSFFNLPLGAKPPIDDSLDEPTTIDLNQLTEEDEKETKNPETKDKSVKGSERISHNGASGEDDFGFFGLTPAVSNLFDSITSQKDKEAENLDVGTAEKIESKQNNEVDNTVDRSHSRQSQALRDDADQPVADQSKPKVDSGFVSNHPSELDKDDFSFFKSGLDLLPVTKLFGGTSAEGPDATSNTDRTLEAKSGEIGENVEGTQVLEKQVTSTTETKTEISSPENLEIPRESDLHQTDKPLVDEDDDDDLNMFALVPNNSPSRYKSWREEFRIPERLKPYLPPMFGEPILTADEGDLATEGEAEEKFNEKQEKVNKAEKVETGTLTTETLLDNQPPSEDVPDDLATEGEAKEKFHEKQEVDKVEKVETGTLTTETSLDNQPPIEDVSDNLATDGEAKEKFDEKQKEVDKVEKVEIVTSTSETTLENQPPFEDLSDEVPELIESEEVQVVKATPLSRPRRKSWREKYKVPPRLHQNRVNRPNKFDIEP